MVLLQRGIRFVEQTLERNLPALLPALLRPHLPVGSGLAKEEPADLFTERPRSGAGSAGTTYASRRGPLRVQEV